MDSPYTPVINQEEEDGNGESNATLTENQCLCTCCRRTVTCQCGVVFWCLRLWRSWIKPLLFVVYICLILIALPLMIIEFQTHETEVHIQAWFIGGLFVVMALPISFYGILQHVVHYTRPDLQRNIIRVLWMVPIYALNAWFALRFKSAAIYLDTIRECYEAYVIYSFMSYLLNFLESAYVDVEETVAQKEQVKHIIPFCCLPNWRMGRVLLQRCKQGVLQYTVVRPITTCIALICEICGVYNEGDFDFSKAWPYLVIINNVSQVWAMYCLVMFYRATKEELAPLKPVSKFMCVKAVVFLSFWQSVVIAILVKLGVIHDDLKWFEYTAKDVSTGIQDFCICIEMFLAAIAHYFSFSHKPYVDYAAEQPSCCANFLDMWNVSDVRDDVVEHVRQVGKTVTRPLIKRPFGREEQRRPLLQSSQNDYGGTDSTDSDPPEILSVDPPPVHPSSQTAAGTPTQDHPTVFDDTLSTETFESCSTNFNNSYREQDSLTSSMNNYLSCSTPTDVVDSKPEKA